MIVYDIRVHDDLFLRDGAGKIIFKICGLPPHSPQPSSGHDSENNISPQPKQR